MGRQVFGAKEVLQPAESEIIACLHWLADEKTEVSEGVLNKNFECNLKQSYPSSEVVKSP